MADNLTVFGTDYTGVMGFKAKGTNNGTLTYIRPFGTKTISVNGTNIDVSEYESVDVNVTVGGSPTGNIDITHSGVTDVTNYATATVPEARQFAAINHGYITQNNMRKWQVSSRTIVDPEEGGQAGWLDEGVYSGLIYTFDAVPTNTTVTPSTSSQTIGGANYMMEGAVTVSAMPSGTAGMPTATKGTVSNHAVSVTPSVTNTTGYITGGTKTGTAVTVSASELVSGSETKTANGTYDVTNLAQLVVDVQGGSTGLQIDNIGMETVSASSSITFTDLQAEPTSFVIYPDSNKSTGSPANVVAVVFDGTTIHGQTASTTSNANAHYDTGFTKSYSNGTLTVTATSASFPSDYWLLDYTYGGSVETADVQVGSGATSITFTNLDDEPEYFTVIFKSNFGTSSGYQRVMWLRKNSENIYGACMASNVDLSSVYWTSSYSNGSLTITSQGTNAGGYFHQPGYYELVYPIDSTGNYQSKIVTPTTSTQEITADSQYDALKKVTVNPIPSQYIVPTGTINITSSGTTDVTNYASASVAAGGATASATKGTVSNHSISVTPSVTRTAGYVTAGSSNGTAVTVSASELVSGTYTVSSSGTKDVTNYASASVAAGDATASATKGTVSSHSITVTPSVTRTAGYITAGSSNGTAVTVSASELVSGSETKTANGTYDVTNLAELVVSIPFVTYYTSSSNPTSSQGSNGDLWLVTA